MSLFLKKNATEIYNEQITEKLSLFIIAMIAIETF